MELSKDTTAVLEFLDYTTGNNLRKRNDLGTILEIGAQTSAYILVNQIIFTGKYLWNLHRMLKKTSGDAEGREKLISEATVSAQSLKEYISELIDSMDDFNRERFDTVYFAEGQGAYMNLIDLAHDLSKLKEVQNTLKRK